MMYECTCGKKLWAENSLYKFNSTEYCQGCDPYHEWNKAVKHPLNRLQMAMVLFIDNFRKNNNKECTYKDFKEAYTLNPEYPLVKYLRVRYVFEDILKEITD